MTDLRLFRPVLRFGLGLLLACLAWQAQAGLMELNTAQATVTVDGQTTQQAVSLPYHWDRLHLAQPGRAVFDIPFHLPQPLAEPYAAYFSRIGTAYEVWINDVLIARGGELEDTNGSDMSKAPRLISIPPQLLRTENLLRIHLRADANRRSGLSTVLLGAQSEVEVPYLKAYRWRVVNSLVIAIISLCAGALAFGLWLTQPGQAAGVQRDPLYWLVGVAGLAWALRVGESVIERPVFPWPWWGVVMALSYVVWVSCTGLFCHLVMRPIASRAYLLALFCLVSGVSVAGLALVSGQPWAWQAWTVWLGVLALWFVGYGFWYAWRTRLEPSVERWIITGAIFLANAAGVRDLRAVTLSGD